MEYACGRGFMFGEEFAQKFGNMICRANIPLSLHAPYYINLATEDEEKQEKTLGYLKDAIKFSKLMHADRIIFHPGGASSGREVSLERAKKLLYRFFEWMEKEELECVIKFGVETHGTKNQLGNIDEIISLCQVAPTKLLPVVDWAHLYSVANGGFSTVADYRSILEKIAEDLGDQSLQELHMHFSSIEYGPSGELRHRTFAEKEYGPTKEPLLQALKELNASGRLICECAGTQDIDALYLKKIYEVC